MSRTDTSHISRQDTAIEQQLNSYAPERFISAFLATLTCSAAHEPQRRLWIAGRAHNRNSRSDCVSKFRYLEVPVARGGPQDAFAMVIARYSRRLVRLEPGRLAWSTPDLIERWRV